MDEQRRAWARLSRRPIFSSPYYDFLHDEYRLPGGGVGNYYYIDMPGSTMIIPRLPSGELVLVRQHRYLMNRSSLEFPAGGLERGVEPLENARRELREEAGYRAARWTRIGEFAPYNGASNELCQVYVAEELAAVEAAPEPTEEIEVLTRSLTEVRRLVRTGELWDGMTLAALRLYESWLEAE